MSDQVQGDPMTDERPAEPDTAGLTAPLDEYVGLMVMRDPHDHWRLVDDRNAARSAVEAAARLCAIEYAESRVRAMQEAMWTQFTGNSCTALYDELAALARLKEPSS